LKNTKPQRISGLREALHLVCGASYRVLHVLHEKLNEALPVQAGENEGRQGTSKGKEVVVA